MCTSTTYTHAHQDALNGHVTLKSHAVFCPRCLHLTKMCVPVQQRSTPAEILSYVQNPVSIFDSEFFRLFLFYFRIYFHTLLKQQQKIMTKQKWLYSVLFAGRIKAHDESGKHNIFVSCFMGSKKNLLFVLLCGSLMVLLVTKN